MMLQLKFFIVAVVLVPAFHMKMLSIRNNFDPGTCAKSNHGELILVKDRENKDTILVCTEREGVYTWKTAEGSKPPGEYFNPGYDCMEILNLNPEAKDGYYWVDFHRSVPYKVWCDMTTDGGGYMLIGRMNDSVTWDVPSTNNTVEPLGFPQWSSAFGDVPVLDFRIQVATDRQYKQVKAHWSFRFKNKRPLKNLLMTNEGGCPNNIPGIGDISFVKNLMTEEIVSKDFPCSVFGAYNHPSAKIGWTMMNSCLEKPCSYGFAYHHLFPVQVYFFGGFSFLAGNYTGSTDGTTAFFGCDKGKCCACYGPPGGSGVYCGKECESKNGGTITKRANGWFWVRLNPPQKVWEKCMEYRTEEENGDVTWYKLVGDRNVPVKGRCGKTEAVLNDGIIVVPDDITADKVPKITGLLAYQKDSEVLSVRKKNAWMVIAEQETVDYLKLQLQSRIRELERQDTSTSSQISQQQRKISELERQDASTNSQISQQQREISELKRQETSTNSQVTQQQRKISDLERKDTSINSQITQQQNRISQLERQDSSIKSQISKLESRITRLTERNGIRLRGTAYKHKGRVEVYHSSHGWGTVCDDDWDNNDGDVVCRQLGFSRASAVHSGAHYGMGTGPILLDDLGCSGSETFIWDCSHRGWNVENCSHAEDASVDCVL